MSASAPSPPLAWTRPALALVLCVLALGVLLRTLGYFDDTNGLWWDEASWLVRIGRGKFGIRPPAYVMLSRALIELSPTEAVVRAPSLAASLLSLPLLLYVCRGMRLGLASTLVGLFVLAVHPWAVAYAKEFKPYAIDLFAHLAVMAAATAYELRPGRRRFALLAAVVATAPLFSWSAAALAPGLVLLVGARALRARARLELSVLGAAVTLALVFGAAVALSGRLELPSSDYWGRKYGVFYGGSDLGGQLRWLGEKTLELVALPGRLDPAWTESAMPARGLELALTVLASVGLVTIVARRQATLACLWLLPWLVVIAANLAGLWPYGVFRTNHFFLVYPLGLALSGLDASARGARALLTRIRPNLGRSPGLEQGLAAGLAVCLCAPFVPYRPLDFRVKPRHTGAESTSVRQLMPDLERLSAGQKRKRRLVMDAHACGGWVYYRRTHPETSPYYRSVLKKRVRPSCLDGAEEKRRGQLLRHLRRDDLFFYISQAGVRAEVSRLAEAEAEVLVRKVYPTGDLLLHTRPRKARRRVAAEPETEEEPPAGPDVPLKAPLAPVAP